MTFFSFKMLTRRRRGQEDRAFQAQSVSHHTDNTSLESKRTPRNFPRRLFLYPVPSAAAQTAPNGVKERASFCFVFRGLNTSSHRMFSMGFRRAKSIKETLTFKKEFSGQQLRDHYPRQNPLDMSFWSSLTFLHHGIDKVERHLL